MKVPALPAEELKAAVSTHNFTLVLSAIIVWLSGGSLILSVALTAGPSRESESSPVTSHLG